ncbi:MAG: YigZ family protein, partial [Lachnospiraceae bacterium]|nr:YigZ family protein [Lachnospiraceae bacterium]
MRCVYRTVSRDGNGIYEEKKSRFLGEVHSVRSEAEAESFLSAARKREYGANHHCYAYVIGEKSETRKCSDDGEPQKTAGMPILNVLLGEGVTNVMLIVSRYFGGTLLGTGGLVRAYESAAKAALSDAGIIEVKPGLLSSVTTDYNGYEKIRRFFQDFDIAVSDTAFSETVKVTFVVEENAFEEISAS